MAVKITESLFPYNFENEDDERVAQLLRIILIALIVLNPITITVWLILERPYLEVGLILLFFLFSMGTYVVMRWKQIRVASFLLSFSLFFLFTGAIYLNGGARSPGIFGYFLVILIAGLLLGSNAAVLFGFLSAVIGCVFLYIETTGNLISPTIVVTSLFTWSTVILTLIMTVILLHLYTQNLNTALFSARQNASALTERNRELHAVQIVLKQHVEELRLAESALRQSEERLRTVVDSAPIILWGIDDEGTYTLAQGKALSQFGFFSDDLVGKSIFRYESSIPNLRKYVRLALQGETTTSTEVLRDRVLEIRFSPLIDNRSIVGVTGVALDITERVRAEEALLQAQKLESLGVLAGGIAHDFNNLLVAMMSQNALALHKLGDRETASANHIGKALRAAERAAQLTRQMLAYAGRSQLETKLVRLDSLVAENLGLLRASIAKNVSLQSKLTDGLPPVLGDSGQLQQVVMNLIINAADAIGIVPGVVVVRSAEMVVDVGGMELWQRVNPEFTGGHCVMVEVCDTGSGMSAATLAKIFDPFFTTKTEGRGLGLAAVSGIVRSHRGDLWVQSELGKGTTFRLLLPVQVESEAVCDAPDEVVSEPDRGGGKLVLVIDDEEPVLEAVTDILALSGLETLTAVSGPTGIDLFKAHTDEIAVILLDLSMPHMNGEETFYALRRIDPTVPIILSSGYDEGEAKKRIADAGQADFLAKPYDVDILSAKVSEYVVA